MDDIKEQNKNEKTKKRRSYITIALTTILLVIFSITIVIIDEKNNITGNFIENVFVSKKTRMKKQVQNIINELKEKPLTKSLYKLEDLQTLGIEIPKTPYDTEYNDYSFILYVGGDYYACFDDGENKMCGDEKNLKYSEVYNDIFEFFFGNTGCDHTELTEEQAINFAKKELSSRYNEEFEVIEVEFADRTHNFGKFFRPVYLTMYSKELGQEITFDVAIDDFEIGDGYYYKLIEKEYEELIRNVLDKYYDKYMIKIYCNDYVYTEDKISKNTSLEDALERGIISASIDVVIDEKLNDEVIDSIFNELKDLNVKGFVDFYSIDANYFKEISDEPLLSIYETVPAQYRLEDRSLKLLNNDE